ncbi:hypothetical protein BIW11_03652 [Tropilaelaps mercedesae]|uniref:Spaetzle domain-containing protein n=1 Tax=Tropilaelaps mercedesae TaxID=418985 RepID=A0A1V9XHR2_9ACAR|nr:hypothetical protein BIW11_03652 [Tropilaelaps mercedesae]
MQGTRPTFGGSNYGNTAFFASPGYIRQGDVFPVRSPPAVRPISHGTSVQEPVYETFAANRGSLYVQRTPLLQNAAFPVEVQLGPEGYHQRSSTGSYGGVDPSYGSIFGQYAPNFGLLDHPDSADTALLGHQQNFVSPGQLYNNQPGKQEGDDYGQHFHLSGPLSLRNMNFIPAENEFSGLRGKQQYLSALSANADSGPFSGGGLRRTKGSYGINLGNYPLSYNEAAEHVSGDSLLFQGGNTAYIGQQGGAPLNGNFGGGVPEDAGQRAKYANAVYNRVAQSLDAAAYSGNGLGNPHQVATVGSAATGVTPVGQDRPISLLTHSGHFPVSPASRGETRPYAILPGGNFHTAQRSHSKSSPAPDAKYQQQSYQKPHCALASDAKLGNATFCTVDEQYPRESVVNSAFLDPLTARRLVPHIQDELHVFAESKDALAIDFTAQKGSTTNSHDIAHENNTQSSSEETKTRPELREACSAEVAMVRPLRAQNTRGEWKVIVNVDTPRNGQKYTQAVRVETCRNALRSCSYVPESLQKSVCSQKLTTYRLAAWSDEEGLHMDTFRFPVACLCLVVATG